MIQVPVWRQQFERNQGQTPLLILQSLSEGQRTSGSSLGDGEAHGSHFKGSFYCNTSTRKVASCVKGTHMRLSVDFSAATLQARRKRQYIQSDDRKTLIKLRLQLRFEEKRSFVNKQKLKEFSTTKPTLQEIVIGILQAER